MTALVDRTYHARVHYAAAGSAGGELDIDARPSDAINLGIRFGAPIYVARAVRAAFGSGSALTPAPDACKLWHCMLVHLVAGLTPHAVSHRSDVAGMTTARGDDAALFRLCQLCCSWRGRPGKALFGLCHLCCRCRGQQEKVSRSSRWLTTHVCCCNIALRMLSAYAQVASQMARPASDFQVKETVSEIERSCREDLAHFPDPTVQLQLQLQLAITGERYSEAGRCVTTTQNSSRFWLQTHQFPCLSPPDWGRCSQPPKLVSQLIPADIPPASAVGKCSFEMSGGSVSCCGEEVVRFTGAVALALLRKQTWHLTTPPLVLQAAQPDRQPAGQRPRAEPCSSHRIGVGGSPF